MKASILLTLAALLGSLAGARAGTAQPLADLRIVSLHPAAWTVMSVTLTNSGAAPSQVCWLRTRTTTLRGTTLGGARIPVLAPGETIELLVECRQPTFLVGQFTEVHADDLEQVVELGERNNYGLVLGHWIID